MIQFQAKVVLTDIEGTTTSINFVKDKLFPYAKTYMKPYLEETWNCPETMNIVKSLCDTEEYKKFNADADANPTIEDIVRFTDYLCDADLKVGPFKDLQGLIWERGYRDGKLRGHVYSDVPAAFERWKESGIKIAIYSSGSVKAQQILFGNSDFGDLLPYISDHFDTRIGHKREISSYLKITEKLGVNPVEILFLTDIIEEARAARSAGMNTVILNRPENNLPNMKNEETPYYVVEDFNSFLVEVPV